MNTILSNQGDSQIAAIVNHLEIHGMPTIPHDFEDFIGVLLHSGVSIKWLKMPIYHARIRLGIREYLLKTIYCTSTEINKKDMAKHTAMNCLDKLMEAYKAYIGVNETQESVLLK